MNIGEIIDSEIERGELERTGVHDTCVPGDIVYHHEWAHNKATGSLVCVMLAGFGKYYLHDLDSKTLVVVKPPLFNLVLMDT